MNDARNPGDEPRESLASTLTGESLAEQVGGVIGPYRLMEQIGEGGFGLVFVAEQQRPVRRRVALKVIKPGMDTRDVIARFEAERQALALMDHPNIARVLDAGTTDSGRPYFVMELVGGVAITDFCDQNHLTPLERLELFISVCHAVQHAHQKGIIHRDIKPSNVLVMLQDGKPVPKVIDFGVAKALHQPLTDKTIYTRFAQMIGTPLYMSPEQAQMSGVDIDTRSDIYSLGVLLYELLTGTTPFDRKRLARAAYDELIRIIRDEEPPKPSTRLNQSTKSLPAIAAQRRTDPARLSRMFRGDLDWITMKALEKDRARRYETASGFAADIVRYLHDELVDASPPSAGYRLRKLARRHRTLLITATAFATLLIAAVIISTWLAIAAQRSAARAATEVENAQNARLAAESQQKLAETEKERADAEAKKARLAQIAAEGEKRRADANAAQSEQRQREADVARKAAEDEKRRAEAALNRSEWRLYVSQITAAQRDWDFNDAAGAWYHLNSCRRDFRGWEYRYLCTLFTRNQKTFRGHTWSVNSVAFSPDGKRIASGSGDRTIKVWSASSGQATLTLKGHTSGVSSVAFSPDGKRIASGSDDKTVKVWDTSRSQELLTLKGHTGPVDSVAFSPDGKRIASGSGDRTIKVWDASSGQEILTLKGHTNGVSSVAFSPDGKRIASGSGDRTIKVWDASGGQEILTLIGHTGSVNSVAYSPDGKRIASGSGNGDNTVKSLGRIKRPRDPYPQRAQPRREQRGVQSRRQTDCQREL